MTRGGARAACGVSGRGRSRRAWRNGAIVTAALVAVAASGCRDGLLHDASAPRGAQFALRPLVSAAGGALDAYAAADRIAIRFVTAGEERLAEVLPFDGSAAETRLSLQVPLRAAAETFEVEVELRRAGDALFRGSGMAEISAGGTTALELPLVPVVASVTCGGDVVVLDALGATTALTAAALFATGDTVAGAAIGWSSSAAGVASVQPSGAAAAVVTAVSEGSATINCTSAGVSGTRAVQVAAVATSIVVSPATIELAPGMTQQFEAVVRDRLGNALTGRAITWSSSVAAVATINAAGLATAVGAGTARIDAAHDGLTGSAVLRVVSQPPGAVTGGATAGSDGAGTPVATLAGTINPRGAATQAWFEYGPSATLTSFSRTDLRSVGGGTVDVGIEETLPLQPNTTYYYRAAASNTHGTTRGEIRNVRLTAVPGVATLPATFASGAPVVNGTVNPRGLATNAWFEWGTSPTLATYSSTSAGTFSGGHETVQLSRSLPQLQPSTDYYVRMAAQNEVGTARGEIVHFRTAAGGPPLVQTVDAHMNDREDFVLVGSVVPNGVVTEVWFEYSPQDPTLNNRSLTQSQFVEAGFQDVGFQATIPFVSSVFWFRAAASNEYGTVYGEIQEVYAFSMATRGRVMIPHGSIRILALLLSGLLLPMAAAAQQRAPDSRPGIAVLPFERGISIGVERETLDALSVGVQQILITELAQNPALRVVDRSVIRDLMAEQDLGASGRVDAQTAARIGSLVGARYVVAGGFNDANGTFRLDGRIVDVETSEVLKADQVTDRRANLYGIIMSLGERLTNGVELPPLPTEVRSQRESRGSSIPREAVVLYSQAQFLADRGQADRARELYVRITTEFPQMTEAAEALRQMTTGAGAGG